MGAQDAYAYAEVNVGVTPPTPDSTARVYAEVNVGLPKTPSSTGYAYAEVDVLAAVADDPPPTNYATVAVSSSSASTAAAAAPVSNLFDNIAGTYWEATATGQATVTATLSAAKTIDQYSITARNDKPTAAPSSWTFQGSNDGGTTWTTIDTQNGQIFSANQTKHYAKSNPTAYTLYRLVITQNGDTTVYPSFADWQLEQWTGSGTPVPTTPSSPTFSSPLHLFGVRYAAGDFIPTAFPDKLVRFLTKRGYLTPPGTLLVKRPVKVDGTSYSAGTTWAATVVPTVAKKLLRGRYLGK